YLFSLAGVAGGVSLGDHREHGRDRIGRHLLSVGCQGGGAAGAPRRVCGARHQSRATVEKWRDGAGGKWKQFCRAARGRGAGAVDEQPKPAKGEPTLTADDRKSVEDQYLVPSPGDALDALDHAGKIDWNALASGLVQGAEKSYPNDRDKALNLGVAVADAFVA